MRGIGLLVVVLGACAVDEPQVAEVESAVSSFQGTSFQGTSFQGTSFQGTSFQGTSFQGTSFQGSTYGGTTISGAGIVGTALFAWRWRADLKEWEQRWPDRICYWDSLRTSRLSCTKINLASSPSPLAGTTFQASFVDSAGTVHKGRLEIGASTGAVGAVRADSTSAMFALDGSDAQANACPLDSSGHRINCDVWMYDVRFPDVLDSSGHPVTFCPAAERAIALAGTWTSNGTFVASGTTFTFACTNGTIAKCTRWGYRPWDSALMSDGTTRAALGPYHQSCVRAASADYCAAGKSFTLNGTLVDIYDYQPWTVRPGFIPRTVGATAFAWESTFDNVGATHIDHTRYPSNSAMSDPTAVCPDRFSNDIGGGDVGTTWDRNISFGSWGQGPEVFIASAPSCAHSEWVQGRFIHSACNFPCSSKILGYGQYLDSTGRIVQPNASCFSPTGSWTSTCVSLATQLCSPSQHMTTHSECTTGAGLPALASQCTLLLSLDPAYAHCATTWDASCVTGANTKCTGGGENWRLGTGFCGGPTIIHTL